VIVMNRPVFFTPRAAPLPGWLVAFPAARIEPYPADIKSLYIDSGQTVWLHHDTLASGLTSKVSTLRSALPENPIIVLSNVPSDEEGLAVFSAGAAGYTGALATTSVLRQIQFVVTNGGLWIGPSLLSRLSKIAGNSDGHRNEAASHLDSLSAREREVAIAVAGGATNKEIARQLGITERTVKAHLSHIFDTLDLRDRLQLAIYVGKQSV